MDNLEPVGGRWNFDKQYHEYCRILGLDAVKRQDEIISKKVYFIVSKLKGKTTNEKLSALLKLRREMGTNMLGELLVNDMYEVSRLNSNIRLEKEQEKTVLKDKAKEAAEKKAAQFEAETQKKIMETQKQIEQERARIKELTDLKARVDQVQGGQYATA